MRIALCYRGRATGFSKGNKINSFNGQFDRVKKFLVQGHKFDVFLHSWSPSVEKELLDLYHPADYIIEDEIIFDNRFKHGMENVDVKNPKILKKTKHLWGPHHKLSILYSICKSLELKRKFERENNFKYDAVFLLRYDLDFFEFFEYENLTEDKGALVYSVPHEGRPKTIPKKTIKLQLRKKGSGYGKRTMPHTGKFIHDHWFASDSATMDLVSKSFDVMKDDRWYEDNPSTSIHRTWDRFFQLIGFAPKKIKVYQRKEKICYKLKKGKRNYVNNPISTLSRWYRQEMYLKVNQEFYFPSEDKNDKNL